MLAAGLIGEIEVRVEPHMLAVAVGSGSLEVLGTPWLVALMEAAACRAVEGRLADGQTTVGTRVDVRHVAATPLGLLVRARAELVEVDGRQLMFRVEAFDTVEKIGEGSHQRALVDAVRLMQRAETKLEKAEPPS
jgi:fluoroacetyl-CoA thioesterase